MPAKLLPGPGRRDAAESMAAMLEREPISFAQSVGINHHDPDDVASTE